MRSKVERARAKLEFLERRQREYDAFIAQRKMEYNEWRREQHQLDHPRTVPTENNP